MTMLITKFHKLIRSKVLWIGFSTIVIISFVFWGAHSTGAPSQIEAISPGKLHGEAVDMDDFQRARINTYVAVTMMLGRALPMSPELNEQLDLAAWNRIVTLEKAERLGITASNEEVNQAVAMNQIFQNENGQFDKRNYDAFAQQFLNPMGITKRAFEEHIREEIAMQKLRMFTDRFTLVTPKEIQRTFHSFSDQFDIEYAVLTPDLVAGNVSVTEEEARAFYDKDPSLFEVPDRIRVEMLAFSLDDALAEVDITDEEIQEFYDFNLDRFEVVKAEEDEDAETPADPDVAQTDDADVEEPTADLAADVEDPDSPFAVDDEFTFSSATTEYRPLEEVRDEIEAELRELAAMTKAMEKASDFVNTLAQRTTGSQRMSFAERVEAAGLETVTLEPISRTDPLPADLDAAEGIQRAAFLLTDDFDYSYSDPIRGEQGAYVISLVERLPRQIPDFEDVKDQAIALAQENAVIDELNDFAEAVLEEARTSIQENGSIETLMMSYGIDVEQPETFTLATAELDTPYSDLIIRSVLTRNSNELTDLLPVENGVLIVHVADRTAADAAAIASLRPQIISTVRRQTAGPLFQAYQDYLLEAANFEPRVMERTVVDDDELM